ncbi:MAG: sulfotransferase [Marinicella sp.]
MTINITQKEIEKICSYIDDEQIARVKDYVMFLGHAHSGHSLIGALLDAHIDIAISNELNIPKLILDHNLSKKEILKITIYFSKLENRWEGEINTGYKYKIQKGHQGLTDFPLILGDKKGGGSTRVIRNNPFLFEKIYEKLNSRLKILHVIRNPMDNIAAFSYYWGEDLGMQHVERYYENMEVVHNLKNKYPQIFHTVSHSLLITEPKEQLEKILQFLEVKVSASYIESCVELIKPIENKRSLNVNWPSEVLKIIKNKNIQFNLTDY